MNNENYVSIEKVENGYIVSMFVEKELVDVDIPGKRHITLKHITYVCKDLAEVLARLRMKFKD